MTIRRWSILVFLNAPASFTAAWTTGHRTMVNIVEMILGVVTFVLIALAIDAWLSRSGFLKLRESLVTATKVKVGLQLVPAIEIAAGYVAVTIAQELFGEPNPKQLGWAYAMTLLTGMTLTLVVFSLTAVIFYVRARRNG